MACLGTKKATGQQSGGFLFLLGGAVLNITLNFQASTKIPLQGAGLFEPLVV
jgi:hypothetical protein